MTMKLINLVEGEGESQPPYAVTFYLDFSRQKYPEYGRGEAPSVTQCKRLASKEIKQVIASGVQLDQSGWSIEFHDEDEEFWSCLLTTGVSGDEELLKRVDQLGEDDGGWGVVKLVDGEYQCPKSAPYESHRRIWE